MKIEIVPAYQNLSAYAAGLDHHPEEAAALWERLIVEPCWPTLCRFAPFDLSERKPKPILSIDSIKKQIALFERLDLDFLTDEMQKITSLLPCSRDEALTVALFPLSDDASVRERQNGVRGFSTFGNIAVEIDPSANRYLPWIPYVFAHEFHHTVWGDYWYGEHGGELENRFVDSLLIDGEADGFALSAYPNLRPRWLFDLSEEAVGALWRNVYSKIVLERNVDYARYMFGDESAGIPWCAGYAVGYRIVRRFLDAHPDVGFGTLLPMRPSDIYRLSGYGMQEKA